MPSQMIRLPNGNFGLFSTIVDNYTAFNLTADEMVAHRRDRSAIETHANLALLAEGKNYMPDDCAISWADSLSYVAVNKQDGGVSDLLELLNALQRVADVGEEEERAE